VALRPPADRNIARPSLGHAGATPAPVKFRVDVTQGPGGVRVCPIGEVDLATVGELRVRIEEAMASDAGRVILDLRQTTFLDSSGLHLAVEAAAWAARSGKEFAIIAGPPDVQRTFDIAGLSELPFVEVPDGPDDPRDSSKP
jgi:anti-anti-sigma factor